EKIDGDDDDADDEGAMDVYPKQEERRKHPHGPADSLAEFLQRQQSENQEEEAEHLRAEGEIAKRKRREKQGGHKAGFGVAGANRRVPVDGQHDDAGKSDQQEIEAQEATE